MVRKPFRRSGMGRGTLPEVWKGSGDPAGGPGTVGGPSQKSRTGRGTLPKVRDGSGNAIGGPLNPFLTSGQPPNLFRAS